MTSLFGADLPDGFQYREDFISTSEEADVVEQIRHVTFSNFEMRGVIAKRRVAFFGLGYDETQTIAETIPEFLWPYRDRAAEWAGVPAAAFVMALINEYTAGAPIGWHRDAPQYGIVAGISLISSCRMKFRPYVSPTAQKRSADRQPRRTTHELMLMPRSAYLITGDARQRFEHSIPAVDTLRYSITFRTLRKGT